MLNIQEISAKRPHHKFAGPGQTLKALISCGIKFLRSTGGEVKVFMEIIIFKKMISPFILQFLFWGAIGGTLYGTYVLLKFDH